jgi:hypothetical protein
MGGLKEDIKHKIFLNILKLLWKLCNFIIISMPRIGLHIILPLKHLKEVEINLDLIGKPYLLWDFSPMTLGHVTTKIN